MVIGVRSSCETADKNASFIWSSSRSCPARYRSRCSARSIRSSRTMPQAIPSPTSTQAGIVSAAEDSAGPVLPRSDSSGTMYAAAASGAMTREVPGGWASPIHTKATTKKTL
jgi:hypothetical protein